MKKFVNQLWFSLFTILALSVPVPAFAAVNVSSPANGSTVVSPVQFTATSSTTCASGVASMGIYVNDQLVYVADPSKSINTNLAFNTGTYKKVVVQEWDYCGGATKKQIGFTVVSQPSGVQFGAVTVASPTPGQQVQSPFALAASDTTCEGFPVTDMAYSVDQQSTLSGLVSAESLSASVTASAGPHTLHVKSWGPNNAACDTDVPVTVLAPSTATSVIPSNAVAVRNIQTFLNWQDWFDTGTIVAGDTSASGVWTQVTSPSLSGGAMQFVSTYVDNGGILYYNNFGQDQSSQNWFLDLDVYVAAPSTNLANVEMDLNQVLPNGDTVIYGFQCDGWNGVWDYTWTDTGTHWTQSKQPCNPRNWSTNTWHHVQIYFSRDNSENVTYHSVWLDGQEQDINQTVHSGLGLGWAVSNILNFQIDGMGTGSGTITTYLDNVTVYRW